MTFDPRPDTIQGIISGGGTSRPRTPLELIADHRKGEHKGWDNASCFLCADTSSNLATPGRVRGWLLSHLNGFIKAAREQVSLLTPEIRSELVRELRGLADALEPRTSAVV